MALLRRQNLTNLHSQIDKDGHNYDDMDVIHYFQ